METTRTLKATNGTEIRDLAIVEWDGGTYLWDPTADPNCDSLEQLQDDSDESVADAIRANGFEIVEA